MQLNILAIGDIVGQPGRKILEKKLKNFIKEQNIGFCIANAENAAGGSGITINIAKKLFSYDIDVITMGDHVWKRKEIYDLLQSDQRLLRPANYSPLAHGRGYVAIKTKGDYVVGIINLLGRIFMKPVDCSFKAADAAMAELSKSEFDVYKRNSCQPDIILAGRHYTTIYSMKRFLYCYILYSYYMVGGYSL